MHHKEAFYATHFTTKADDFDINVVSEGENAILNRINQLNMLGNDATAKEKNMISVLEVAYEMVKRGVKMGKVDLYKSHATKFMLAADNTIIPPLLAVPGLGNVVAENIFMQAQKKPFISVQDLKDRTGTSKTVVEQLESSGCLDGLSKTNQISFSF